MRISDWSSDVCSSDLTRIPLHFDRLLVQPAFDSLQRAAAPRLRIVCGAVEKRPPHALMLVVRANRDRDFSTLPRGFDRDHGGSTQPPFINESQKISRLLVADFDHDGDLVV